MAVASLVLGIASIAFCLGMLTGLPAVVCAHKARKRIRNSGGQITGESLASAGLVTGLIGIAMSVVLAGLLASIAIPNFIAARNKAQANACKYSMKAIEGAKAAWKLDNNKPATAIPTEADLFGPDKYMADKPKCPSGGTYTINALNQNVRCSVHGQLKEVE